MNHKPFYYESLRIVMAFIAINVMCYLALFHSPNPQTGLVIGFSGVCTIAIVIWTFNLAHRWATALFEYRKEHNLKP